MSKTPRKEGDSFLTVTPEVLDYLAKEGYDPKFGARPLKRAIQSRILTPVANMMVGEGMLQKGTVKVSMRKGELAFDISKMLVKKRKPNYPASKLLSVPK